MTTLQPPTLDQFSADDREILDHVAARLGRTVDDLLRPGIFGVQAHWPAWLEANLNQARATYMHRGLLPPLVKEAMHVAVSMGNGCDY